MMFLLHDWSDGPLYYYACNVFRGPVIPSRDSKPLGSRSQAQGLEHGRLSIKVYRIKLKHQWFLYVLGSNSTFLIFFTV